MEEVEEIPGILTLDKDSLELLFSKLNPQAVINLCNSSSKLRELCTRYKLWVFASGQFEKMSGDTLTAIMRNMRPFEVVMFCASSPGFTRVCNRGSFWRNVLTLHYDEASENPKETYLRSTYMHFSLHYDDYSSRNVVDSLGHDIEIVEQFDRDAYLVPEERVDMDETADLQVVATDFHRDKVWVGATGSIDGVHVAAYRTKEDAIFDFVNKFDDFIWMFEMAADRLAEVELEYIEERMSPAEVKKAEDRIDFYYDAEEIDPNKKAVIFFPAEVFDKLFEMGYPHFYPKQTEDEAREVLYNYIDKNGFFGWGTDFRKGKVKLDVVKCFQVFEVKLHKTFPAWYTN